MLWSCRPRCSDERVKCRRDILLMQQRKSSSAYHVESNPNCYRDTFLVCALRESAPGILAERKPDIGHEFLGIAVQLIGIAAQ